MAWLSSGAAGRTKSAAGKPIQRAAGRKNYARSAAIPLLFSLGFRSCCSRRAAPPAARCLQRTAERGRKLLHRSSVAFFCLWLFSFFPRRQGHKGALRTEAPPPKQQVIRSSARRRPFWGGAGRRPLCPNGALLEKNGAAWLKPAASQPCPATPRRLGAPPLSL